MWFRNRNNNLTLVNKNNFYNPEGVYFVSFVVVEWLDVFTRNEYKDIIIDSLHYCQKEKGIFR